ncbi:GNAT family N-acetyltransferase [Trichlorobacter ammonificans]|uniref:N-acetyltransferase n=1 Tax=Trichlorobacter ammonificans TaxID=2916410 RepID=A0ABM9D4T4_9BACT|nr:GNAT family N-acetyltransferase [Trichlorobacter ammonificans]CAH2030267.1 N-acetyltransferase [Trichlorobacter ammonificans]
MTILTLDSTSIRAHRDDLAGLRLTIFREYPYLYDGRLEDERHYLSHYADHGSVLAALDGGTIVGAITGMPLDREPPDFTRPFRNAGRDPAQYYYIGELLLQAPYRGSGLGSRMLAQFEQQIRQAARFTQACCATVVRPDDHPLRPAGFRPVEPFCRRHGYAPVPGAVVQVAWRQLDGTRPRNSLQYWEKTLP